MIDFIVETAVKRVKSVNCIFIFLNLPNPFSPREGARERERQCKTERDRKDRERHKQTEREKENSVLKYCTARKEFENETEKHMETQK